MSKRILIFLIILLSIGKIYSSPQMYDLIIVNGDTLPLYSLPLEEYLTKNKIEFECLSTGNYRGYYAIWELRNDSLYLNEILDCSKDYKNVVNEIFNSGKLNRSVFASWYSDTLWVEIGKKVFHQHSGWGAYYDQENAFVLSSGKISSSIKYDYRDKIKIFNTKPGGLSLPDYINSQMKLNEQYSEEKELKFVLSAYKDSIRILYPESIDTSNVYIKEVFRIVKELRPYTVVYLCGEEQVIGYSIPFRFENEFNK